MIIENRKEEIHIKFIISFLLVLVGTLLFFNLQITETFDEKFHGKQFSTFYMDYNEKKIEIGMIGDILLHLPLYNYVDFVPSFEPVKEELASIDFLVANQESIPAGKAFGLSGYPEFSSPPHIIRDLKTVGVDLLSIANNHTLDQQEAGLLAAIGQMKQYDMPYIGAYESLEDSQRNRVFQVEDVTIGFLSYTYGTNGHDTPAGKDYLVNRMDRSRIEKDILTLKQKADIVVVSMHWGTEYEREPNHSQQELANLIAQAGADIIFGHHPHVIQPYELITTDAGHKTHTFYSLGNFFSGQKEEFTNIGGIAKVEILVKQINGEKVFTTAQPSFIPTAVIKGKPYTINLLKDVETEVGKQKDTILQHVFKN